jgi:hypothetical protein
MLGTTVLEPSPPPPAPSADWAAMPSPSLNPLHDFVARFRSDPLSFVKHVLEVTPDPWQLKILQDLARGATRISIRSGNGVGKTTLLSWILLWFVITRYPSKAVCTAPTSAQLFDALFSEVKFWAGHLPDAVRGLLVITSDHIALAADTNGAFISARTNRPESPEALQGVHSANVLLVVDEGSGVDERVYEAGFTSMSTPGAITILAGNPLRNSGFFYRTHTDLADQWTTYQISGLDSPRVSPAFIEEVRRTYGELSIEYRVKVLGQFPLRDTDSFISASIVDAAMQRDLVPDPLAPTLWGLDVARFGDDRSCLFRRNARMQIGEPRIWRGIDTMQLVGAVKVEYDNIAVAYKPLQICVDSIGVGAGVVDRLRELELPAIGINVAESPSVKGDYNRLRDQLWGEMRQWLESREVSLLKDERLALELQAPRYSFTSTGKLVIESKDTMRKRVKASPDIADALALTFASDALTASGQTKRFPFNKPLPIETEWVV